MVLGLGLIVEFSLD